MEAFWRISRNIRMKAAQFGFTELVMGRFRKLIRMFEMGHFSYMLRQYYPNKRPLGEFITAKQQQEKKKVVQKAFNDKLEIKQRFASSIQKDIHKLLKTYVERIGPEDFSPKEFQEELGLSLGIRSDIKSVKLKKIIVDGQNTARVSIEVIPAEWEDEVKLAFNFEFNGLGNN